MFDMVDKDRSGKINAAELKAALINGRGENFSDTACNLMIGMFDLDKSGTIDVMEFEKLFGYINQWLGVFKTYDRDQSGHIDEGELFQALSQMGFRFSQEFIKFLVAKCDTKTHKEVSVDQFIVLCKFLHLKNEKSVLTFFFSFKKGVQIQRFTDAFRVRDTEQNGTITIGFEDFLTIALSASS